MRPGFQWNSVQENTPANFEVIALDERGRQKAVSNVTWELVFEDIDYRWYQVDNDWRYERIVNDRIVEAEREHKVRMASLRACRDLAEIVEQLGDDKVSVAQIVAAIEAAK